MILKDLLAIMNIDDLTIPVCCYHFDHNKLKGGTSLYYHFLIEEKKTSFKQKGKEVNVRIPYIFAASNKDDGKSKKENEEIFFSLDVEYDLLITLENEVEIEDDLKQAFLEGIAPRILHPYFRQSVAEALQKVGLPQFNLPLFENISESAGF